MTQVAPFLRNATRLFKTPFSLSRFYAQRLSSTSSQVPKDQASAKPGNIEHVLSEEMREIKISIKEMEKKGKYNSFDTFTIVVVGLICNGYNPEYNGFYGMALMVWLIASFISRFWKTGGSHSSPMDDRSRIYRYLKTDILMNLLHPDALTLDDCVAASTITIEGDSVPGHVGVPSPCNIVKLVDVPELGYFARDNAGEVCINKTNVFEGYYKNEEQTKEVLDNDGWLHTGDIGRWTEDGTLKIVDCKKHIFKLAKGEYAPERIENLYLSSKFVAQSFVYGENLKTCLIAIIVPDHEVLLVEASKALGIAKLSMEELCQREDVKKMIMDDLFAVGKAAGLYSFEQVKDIFLSSEMFSVGNDLLTPTLKSKRPKLKEHFKAQITSMYEKLD
uniref:AMP-dependent synthetase/ligase domain-containing protein n=1 Tax=Panagrolaimus sp. ES5 TaxID=591445 RepID=A0AC34FT42_9BILA